MAHRLWPLFDLAITTPRLVMRVANDDELAQLCTVGDETIFANSASTPFVIGWPLLPSPDRELSVYQWHTGTRANWQPQNWTLPLTAFFDGTPIGSQGIESKNFARRRSVETGSWLGADWQGKGLGTEMRAAVLELAFAELGAVEALSTARVDNPRSAGVSHKLGYEDNGVNQAIFVDEPGLQLNLRLTREAWQANRMPGINITGLDSCRHFFGADGETWQTPTIP